jgi:hypothetical protein
MTHHTAVARLSARQQRESLSERRNKCASRSRSIQDRNPFQRCEEKVLAWYGRTIFHHGYECSEARHKYRNVDYRRPTPKNCGAKRENNTEN